MGKRGPRTSEVRDKIAESLRKRNSTTQHHYNRKDPIARFWSRTDRRDDDECWPWLAGTTGGYGTIMVDGRMTYAHILSYKIHNGSIPEGHDVHHNCTNRSCVNPRHLGTMPKSDHGRLHRLEQLRQ